MLNIEKKISSKNVIYCIFYYVIIKSYLNKYINSVFGLFLFLFTTSFVCAQSISGNLVLLKNQPIKLEGFSGLKTRLISTTIIDDKGNFILPYSIDDYGVGFLISSDQQPLIVILSGEDIEIVGEALSYKETIKVIKGKENQLFEKYAKEYPRREQMISAWQYLEKTYMSDSLFMSQLTTIKLIQDEKKRIKNEDSTFLKTLPKDSYVSWFLPIRKLVSSVPTIAQYRPQEIHITINSFRTIDYCDKRIYKSGLFKDVIESHFWLLENSGLPLDSIYVEMQKSIDIMMLNLIKDEQILNEVTDYLFDLLERHSLFQASEYLALKVLNEISCTIDNDLAKQLESYRTMKKGNLAPDINLENNTYKNGIKQNQIKTLANLKANYKLVVFGASWCTKCTEELPKLIQNYQKWTELGIEVIYISLDVDIKKIEQTIDKYPFYTYCDFKKWDSQIVKDYYVFGTPTMYILNNKLEILLRPNSISQIEAWVNWNILQGNK